MNPLFIAIAIGLGCFLVFLVVTTKLGRTKLSRAQQMLNEADANGGFRSEGLSEQEGSILRVDYSGMPALQLLAKLPFGEEFSAKVLRAGFQANATPLIFLMFALMLLLPIMVMQSSNNLLFAVLTLFAVPYAVWRYLQSKIDARNRAFINDFPDVLDMIVRSVRSGFPLNTALNMVADNMEAPVSTEFRQVVDEIALGRTLDDALLRLNQRIDEPDVKFFIVVLRVQQETGGNLAEVISNLSNVIRKRKQLRLKIRAMTSEGRATGYILAAIPVVMFLALYFMTPGFLDSMLNTSTGHLLLGIAAGLIILSQVIVRKMLNVEI